MRHKIIFAVGNLGRGGAEKQLVTILCHLPQNQFDITVVNFSRNKDEFWTPTVRGLPIRLVEVDPQAGHIGRFLALRRVVRELRPDTVWAWHFFTGAYIRPLKLLGYRFRHIQGVRSTLAYLHSVHRWANSMLRSCDLIVANSKASIDAIRQLGLPEDRLQVMPNAIDVEWVKPVLNDTVRLVGMCCNLHPRKGIDIFLDAIALLKEAHPGIQFRIDGDGDPAPYQEMAKQRRVADVVSFGGAVSCQDRVRELDIFVLPSRHEGIPNVLMEAMAVGRPSVACNVGGVREMVGDGDCACLVVPPEDPDALAAALASLLSSPEKRAALSQGAFERAAAFRPEQVYGLQATSFILG